MRRTIRLLDGIKISEKTDQSVLVDLVHPKKEDTKFLLDKGFQKDDIDDSLDVDEVPKLLKQAGYIHAVLKLPVESNGHFQEMSFGLFLYQKSIFIVRKFDSSFFSEPEVFCAKNHVEFLQKLLRQINKQIQNIFKKTNANFKLFEKKLSQGKGDENMAIEMWKIRDDVSTLLRVLKENEMVYNTLARGLIVKMNRVQVLRFEDIYEDLHQMISMSETLKSDLTNAFDTFISMTSFTMSRKIENLTYITIALSIPAIIGAFYGMNFIEIPFKAHPMGFSAIVAFSLLFAVIIYSILNR
ncbi:MAG: magnesium transporter CorA family protein [Candidatus Altiarchaeota archaeon]|nr:magnesium transporter CorA family protein [Candidatus Altiarchaeota archaeon]